MFRSAVRVTPRPICEGAKLGTNVQIARETLFSIDAIRMGSSPPKTPLIEADGMTLRT